MKLRKKQPQPETVSGYDYSDREARERTVYALFQRAKNARTAVEIEWEKCNDYYNGIHDVTLSHRVLPGKRYPVAPGEHSRPVYPRREPDRAGRAAAGIPWARRRS